MSIFNFFTSRKNNNWKIIILSILGATIFWFFNALNKNYNAKISFPLEYNFARDSVIIVKPLINDVRLNVTGGGWTLFRKTFWLNIRPIIINLDNPTVIKYYTRSSLLPIISDQLDELKLNYIITDTLFINIEKKIIKTLKIRVDSLGISLKENHRIVSPILIQLDSVQVIGPKSIMNKMNLYIWINIDEDNIDDDFDNEVGFSLPNDQLVSTNPNKVNLKFNVEQFNLVEMFIKIDTLNFPKDSSVYLIDSLIKINYIVNEKFASDISKNDFNIALDFTFLNKKDSTISPLLMYAHEKAIEINFPEKVKVEYAKK